MSAGASRFYTTIENPEQRAPKELVGLFVYYLTVELQEASATKKSVETCFTACDLAPPARTASFLSEGVAEGIYVKAPEGGYKLQRHYREEISKKLGAERVVVQANAGTTLRAPNLSRDPLLRAYAPFTNAANAAA